MKRNSKIFVAGHGGLVGSAIVRTLKSKGYKNLLLRTRKELDLRDKKAVFNFFTKEKPEYVFLAAAKVGGIVANNTFPADFILENLEIQNNVISAAHECKTKKLLFLGSSCIYPKLSKQPIKEGYLLTGELEKTNEAYALAKIAGLKMCEYFKKQYGDNFISAMPTNLYGENDNFDLTNSHVIPALLRKFHEAKIENKKEVILWGSGKPKREFLHVDDLAEALVFLMEKYDGESTVNVGTGADITIKELGILVKKITGFQGKIVWDKTKPDGTPRKLLDISKIKKLGWKPKTKLETGLQKTYQWYLKSER